MNGGRVRRFAEEDIPQVSDLHRRVFGIADPPSTELERSYRSYFSDVFLNHPWRDEGIESLVYEERSGRITAFLGVVPRPMWCGQRFVRAAVSSQFVVEPEREAKLAGAQLLRAFLAGPQDLSIADEANDASRRLWERLGGRTALLYSIHWTCLLRPAEFLRARLKQGRRAAAVVRLSAPFCRAVDAVVGRTPLLRRKRPAVLEQEAGGRDLLACSASSWNGAALQPEYDERSIEWLLDRAAQGARLEKTILKNEAGETLGWHLYRLGRDGIAEALQIGASQCAIRPVLDHLFYHAWRKGAVAVTGRLEPKFLKELWEQPGLLQHRRHWMLVHSPHADLLNAIHRGDAVLTRLEGEWCLRFAGWADLSKDAG